MTLLWPESQFLSPGEVGRCCTPSWVMPLGSKELERTYFPSAPGPICGCLLGARWHLGLGRGLRCPGDFLLKLRSLLSLRRGAATLATGFLVTAGCISCYTYQPPQQEVDPNKVMARLRPKFLHFLPAKDFSMKAPKAQREETCHKRWALRGEREVLLQPAAFRTSTSVPVSCLPELVCTSKGDAVVTRVDISQPHGAWERCRLYSCLYTFLYNIYYNISYHILNIVL